MDDRIAWRCPCGNPLTAPSDWRGRTVRCPACGAPGAVPADGDPGAEAQIRAPQAALRDRRSPAPAPSPGLPYGAWEMRTEGGPAADDPFFQRFRNDAREARRRSRRRRWLPAVAAVAAVALLAGGGLLSRHLWKTRWSAAARMERAGFGNRLDRSDGPRWRTVADAVQAAEERHQAAGGDLPSAVALRDAYRRALQEECEMPAPRQVHLLNNAAWFLATTPHPEVRDPSRALVLGGQAADLSQRRAAHVLDTLAEALFATGDARRAAATEDEALALEPEAPFYRQQAARFRTAAGLPPLPPLPPAPSPDVPPAGDPGPTAPPVPSPTPGGP